MTQVEHGGPISARDFMALGLREVAYIKPVRIEGELVYAVHAADGREMALMASHADAWVAIQQNDLQPLSVH